MIDWSAVRAGDPDPEGDMAFRVSGVCGQAETYPLPTFAFRCTRSPHVDGIHVASGTRGKVISVWRTGAHD